MRFEDIKGLEVIKTQLINSVKNDQIAHAQLFTGKPGSPTLPMALAYITYLNCENRQEHDACGECAACSKNQKFVHPDLHFVFPVSGTKDVKSEDALSINFIKQWRQFLTDHPFGDLNIWSEYYGGENKQVNISKQESREIIKGLSLKSFEGGYKAMIIWLPEYMHPNAANGILKILEEPPEKTLFILVSNDTSRLISTITSRTQRVNIPLLSDADIQSILMTENGLGEQQAAQISQLADGDINVAQRIATDVADDNHEFFVSWMRNCHSRNFTALVSMADTFHSNNKLSQRSLLKYALSIFRETLIYQNAPEINRVNGNILDFIQKFSSALNETKVASMTQLLDEAYFHLERNGSPKMIFLDLSLHLAAEIK